MTSWEIYLAEGSKNMMKTSFEMTETDGEGWLLGNPCRYGNIERRRRGTATAGHDTVSVS
jgi:hypothetical protein